MSDNHAAIDATIKDLGLTMTAVFIPWSKSRRREDSPRPSDYSLNWRVTLLKGGKEVITTDYSAGIGHCRTYPKHSRRPTIFEWNRVVAECEGKAICEAGITRANDPALRDIVHSILMDSEVIDHGSFESWAMDYGYNPDSRKAEATYRTCLEHGLKLRLAIGNAGITQLREVFQDY
jgi:uncharacterized protein YodC (DUF2158 family)